MGRIRKGQEPKVKLNSFLIKKEVHDLINSQPHGCKTMYIEEAILFFEKYRHYINEDAEIQE